MLRSRSAREKVSPADSSCRNVVAVEQRDGAVAPFGQRLGQPAGDGGLAGPGQAGEEDGQATFGPGRPGPAQLPRHARRSEPGGNLGAGIEQRAELGIGQLALLGSRFDQRERAPHFRPRVVGPLAGADDRDRHSGQRQRAVPGPGRRGGGDVGRVGQQVGSAVGRGHAGLGAQVGGARPVRPGVTRRERYGDDEGAGRQVRPGRQDRADQRLGPGHDLGGPADQGQHQQARVQLARVVAQLPDVTPVQGAPGRVGEHVAPGRLGRCRPVRRARPAGAAAAGGTARARARAAR